MGKLDTYYEAWKGGDLDTGIAFYADNILMISAEDGIVTDKDTLYTWLKIDWLAFSLRTMTTNGVRFVDVDNMVWVDIEGENEEFPLIRMSGVFVFNEQGKVCLRTSKATLQRIGDDEFISEAAYYESESLSREVTEWHGEHVKRQAAATDDSLAADYAEDAALLTEEGDLLRGRDSVSAYLKTRRERMRAANAKILKTNTNIAGNVALVHLQLRDDQNQHIDGSETFFYKNGIITHHFMQYHRL